MSNSSKMGQVATVVLRIPHISRLFVFKEILGNQRAIVKMTKELLKIRRPEVLYSGYDYCHSREREQLVATPDAAIMLIFFPDKNLIRRDVDRTLNLIRQEFDRPRNEFLVEEKKISHEKDITSVAITVRSSRNRKLFEA